MDDERAPAVALARVLAGVRGADHAVGDLAAGVASEATRGPAEEKRPVSGTVHVYTAVSPAYGFHLDLIQLIRLGSSKRCGPPPSHHSLLVLISLNINTMLCHSFIIVEVEKHDEFDSLFKMSLSHRNVGLGEANRLDVLAPRDYGVELHQGEVVVHRVGVI